MAEQPPKFVCPLKGALVALALLLPYSTAPADAASCNSLQAELNRLSSGSRVSPKVEKWQVAARQQQKAIDAAKRDARYFQCSKLAATPKCQQLNKKIGRMQANLHAIDRQLAKAQRKAPNTKGRIRQIRAALNRQNCFAVEKAAYNRTSTARVDQGTRKKGLIEALFGRRGHLEVRAGDNDLTPLHSRAKLNSSGTRVRLTYPSGGTYRTLCVRTCDGYFFPVSFSTHKNQLADDAARCSEMCPSAETELFVYRNPGETPENMTSLQGVPYKELPNAFRYKTEYVQGCSCRALNGPQQARGFEELTESGGGMASVAGNLVEGSQVAALKTIRTDLDFKGIPPETSPYKLSREPMNPDHISVYADPDTRFNLKAGFNVLASVGHEAANDVTTSSVKPEKAPGLPVLTSRQHASAEEPPVAPVFNDADKASQMSDEAPKTGVRVVGPEFFVAQ